MKRRRRAKNGHDYSVLEPRQLLATTGLPQFDGDASIDTGLIVNADFDQNEVADATAERVLISDVPGWSQTAGASDTISLVGFNDSPRGTGFHLDAQADVLESISQDVAVVEDQLYTLAFDLLGRPVGDTADASTNDVRILWDGEQVGIFSGITDFWQTFTVTVRGTDAETSRLEIQEVDGVGNDGVGAMLDNLRLVPVSNQAVENGSFEDNESGTVSQDDVPGWSVSADEDERLADIQTGTASDGSQFVNLDRQSDNSDILFTDITTENGGIYFVSFDLRSESGVVGEDEEVRVRWNDEWVGTYRGNSDWQSFGFTVRADSDLTRLVFREPGGEFTGDGDGPLLDNVTITKVVPSLSVSVGDTTEFEFTENDGQLELGSGITAINSTVSDAITGFTVSLPASADSATEILRVDGLDSFVESEDGTLTFEADLNSDEFLTVLQTLTYENTSDNPVAGTRSIAIQVSSGSVTSPSANLTVNVTPVNDVPVITDIADGMASVDQLFNVQATATDAEDETITWSVTAAGSAILDGDVEPTIDSGGTISWTPAREGAAVFTVRATDATGDFSETQFSVTATEQTFLDTGNVIVNSGTDLPLFDSTAATDDAIGETLADFEAQTITGEAFNSIEPGVGRIYAVLAHWCPFCNDELPEIVEWLGDTDLGDDVEFVAAAVSVDPDDETYPPSQWFSDAGYDGTIIVDNTQAKLMDLLGTDRFPFLVGVDSSGEVVYRSQGLSTQAQFDAALAAVRS
ncbi:DUF642 domain-containing protein [Mariniblastus fucicola]|uniref:Thioredoxin domain-containing protein n=1 Tax=Mariniblastus fucicola TaxID=980251 RepID=A0A5B9P4L7_9BACT|nr:DUF642 domain-containing protein [Mariniblastus fucicola]QEG21547.1 hypothetical protein MFFC18_14040 [Mariniblastus fucicola]